MQNKSFDLSSRPERSEVEKSAVSALIERRRPRLGYDFKAANAVQVDHVVMHLPRISPLFAGVGANLGDPRRVFYLNQRVISAFDVPNLTATFHSLTRSCNPAELNMTVVFDPSLTIAESDRGADTISVKVRLGVK